MIIAHLPTGYLAAKAVRRRFGTALFWGILAGSILPDLDMLWFYFVDSRQTHHHDYLTHRPALWACLGFIGLAVRHKAILGLGLGALLHLCLDSIVGKIAWAWPLNDHARPLVTVPATHDWWVMSFVTHWTLAAEIALCLLALGLFIRRRR